MAGGWVDWCVWVCGCVGGGGGGQPLPACHFCSAQRWVGQAAPATCARRPTVCLVRLVQHWSVDMWKSFYPSNWLDNIDSPDKDVQGGCGGGGVWGPHQCTAGRCRACTAAALLTAHARPGPGPGPGPGPPCSFRPHPRLHRDPDRRRLHRRHPGQHRGGTLLVGQGASLCVTLLPSRRRTASALPPSTTQGLTMPLHPLATSAGPTTSRAAGSLRRRWVGSSWESHTRARMLSGPSEVLLGEGRLRRVEGAPHKEGRCMTPPPPC